jgi:acetyltransferase
MSTYRLEHLFRPRSLALLGASTRERSLGRMVLRNLRDAGFAGALHVVNPNHTMIDGIETAASLGALAAPPDMIVVTAPPPAVPDIILEAASKGVAVAVIITAGLGRGPNSLAEKCLAAARTHGLRIVGPNGLGVLVPGAKLNASFAARSAQAGDLALISQSGAIAAGLIEWSARRSIGFSGVISLGDAIDVDFGDLLDYFALDPATRAILLYIEGITAPAKFLSAARAAARVKPVIVIKAGRQPRAAKAAATHTGALAGSDAVYDAAFRRAGLLRVTDLDELFQAAEALRVRSLPGKRLAILTNGGGVGVLAVDRLLELGGSLAELSADTLVRLDAVLPAGWSQANPVDIIGDAGGERYAQALEILLADRDSDAVLVLNVPTALASAPEAANAVVEVVVGGRSRADAPKPVFAAWIGEDPAAVSAFEKERLPHYATGADAVRGFMHLVRFREAREALMTAPESLPQGYAWDALGARSVIGNAIAKGQRWLDPLQIAELLGAYRIPVAQVILARDPEEAFVSANTLLKSHAALVAKILSPDIAHKSDIGGVRLNLVTPEAVRDAAREILEAARQARPQARITGVTLHPMIVRPLARELIAGIADDLTFGPVIVFGRGGTSVEVINDKALALPPLDLKTAHDLIARTRVSAILHSYRDVPAADIKAVALTLVALAQMAADVPEIRELDLNPLLADSAGIMVLDARVAIAPVTSQDERAHGTRLAIRPYPGSWQRKVLLPNGLAVSIRPIRPEDEGPLRSFFGKVTEEDLRLRFFTPVTRFTQAFIARLTQLDYSRAIAFIATAPGGSEILGVVRLHIDANHEEGAFAILVRSDLKGRGLGWMLMQLLIEYARSEDVKIVTGQVLSENATMLAMCRELGFIIGKRDDGNGIVSVRLPVSPNGADAKAQD